jgi:DNA repair exonuclease SbcCD ATPase subunit
MSPELFNSFQAEIRRVGEQIKAEGQLLSTEEDREEAERLRFRIKNMGKVLDILKSNLTSIVIAERNAEDLQSRFIRWRDLCAKARRAQDEMESLQKQIGPAVNACVPFANAVARAEAAIEQHRAIPLPDYPTEPERARKQATEARLKLALDEARTNLREHQLVVANARNAWMVAVQKYDAACFTERTNRLPADEPAASKFSRVA